MQIETLHDLFVYELRAAYYMERQLVDILGEMAEHATNDKIKDAFDHHQEETERHVEQLQDAFEKLDLSVDSREWPLIDALATELQTIRETVEDPELLNLFYLGTAVKIERIELTVYNNLLRIANRVGLDTETTGLLEQNRDNEENTLTQLQTLTTASELKTLWEKIVPG